jgi:hypothetical protein
MLQKLEKFLFLLYNSVWTSGSQPRAKIKIIEETVNLLLACELFLGPVVRIKLFEVLIARISEQDMTIRAAAIKEIQRLNCSGGMWTEFHRFLSETFEADIHGLQRRMDRLSSYLDQENDEFISSSLSRIIGTSRIAGRIPINLTKELIKSLSKLSNPSVDQLSNSVFVNKDYIFGID